MTVVTVRAPAKLNLFLHILGRRPDGYHELQTLFQLIDLCDEVRIEGTTDGGIERQAPTGDPELARLPDEADLMVRAAKALQDELRRQGRGHALPGARLHVTKHIPSGGGLGGGSADAGATLRVLNRLWSAGLAEADLARIAVPLGADVPLFALGRTAWGEGRGEHLTPVATPQRWFVVVDPGVAVSTAAVFADAELTRDSAPLTMRDLDTARLRNDCEGVVRRRYPAVAAALEELGRHGEARLTGTGGCVFAAFASEAGARSVADRLSPSLRRFVARGLSESGC